MLIMTSQLFIDDIDVLIFINIVNKCPDFLHTCFFSNDISDFFQAHFCFLLSIFILKK